MNGDVTIDSGVFSKERLRTKWRSGVFPRSRAQHRATPAVVNALSVEFLINTHPLCATSLIPVVTRYFFPSFSSIVRG